MHLLQVLVENIALLLRDLQIWSDYLTQTLALDALNTSR